MYTCLSILLLKLDYILFRFRENWISRPYAAGKRGSGCPNSYDPDTGLCGKTRDALSSYDLNVINLLLYDDEVVIFGLSKG